jgi:peptidoglycan/xylan/chitin deacetylase (PgdA/CDA1 family)
MTDPDYGGGSMCLSDYGLACDGTPWPPGYNTSLVPRPKFGDVPYGKQFWSCNVENTLAMTYDDGSSEWTHGLLDILKANNVKATFYIRAIGMYSDLIHHVSAAKPAIIRRIYNEGHQVAGRRSYLESQGHE